MQTEIKEQVEKILETLPITRNDDLKLTAAVWGKYYPQCIIWVQGEPAIKLRNLKSVPTQDVIKRIRAKIQNEEHRFLPTTLEVARRRKWSEQEWRRWLALEMPMHP